MWKYVKAVALRELRIWMQRPIYFVGSLGVILFGSIFFLTFFKAVALQIRNSRRATALTYFHMAFYLLMMAVIPGRSPSTRWSGSALTSNVLASYCPVSLVAFHVAYDSRTAM